jgi:hypothetical protein
VKRVSPEADRDIIATEKKEATENFKLITPLRPEGENGVCDIGVVNIGAADGVIAIDGFSELFGTGAFGEERDE